MKKWNNLTFKEKRQIFWEKFDEKLKETYSLMPNCSGAYFTENLIQCFDLLIDRLSNKEIDGKNPKILIKFSLDTQKSEDGLIYPVVHNLSKKDLLSEQKIDENLLNIVAKYINATALATITNNTVFWLKKNKIWKLGYDINGKLPAILDAINLNPEYRDKLIFEQAEHKKTAFCPVYYQDDSCIFIKYEYKISPAIVNLDLNKAYHIISMGFDFFESNFYELRQSTKDCLLSEIRQGLEIFKNQCLTIENDKSLSKNGNSLQIEYSKNITAPVKLTERQKEVLIFVKQGLQNKEISEQLGISIDMVKGHLKEINKRLETNNRTEAVTKATEYNLI